MSTARPYTVLPVVDPRETIGSMTDTVLAPVLATTPLWWWIAFLPALGLLGLGVVSVGWLFLNGITIWGNDWPVMWGFPLINYVWWIGIASGGTFISAMFFLLRVEWRTSVNRIAETMTLFAAACAGIYPILHLGRPWFFYWLFPYPNTMTLWPNWKSPLLWDFMAILTYVISSVLFWFLGALPDLATVRDRARGMAGQIAYGFAAMGFRGSGTQWRHFRACYAVLAAIMAPLVCSVHSIVGLDFAGGATTGWHSTEFPPFFVFGAILSGFGAVLMLILPLRRLMGLRAFITDRHIDVLARLLLTSSLCVSYAYMMDAFNVFYGGDPAELRFFHARITGSYAGIYWATLMLNCVVPLLFSSRAARLNEGVCWSIGLAVVVGMWLERYGIVIVSLHRPPLPSSWGDYSATFWDWSLMAGTVGLFFTGFLLTIRVVPAISMFEMRELLEDRS